MILKEVLNKESRRQFEEVNILVNKGNPFFVRPLSIQVESVFNPLHNPLFKKGGEAIRYVLLGDDGSLLGRVAAFVNPEYANLGTDFPVGGMGYFDCINDFACASCLMDAARDWLKLKGMAAMDGPINFGGRDINWGLMVEGFERQPIMGMAYNPPYYQSLFENYGFLNYYNQYFFYLNARKPLPDRFSRIKEIYSRNPDYQTRHLAFRYLNRYAADIATVYNAAWGQHQENKTTSPEDVIAQMRELRFLLDPEAIWLTYYKGRPVGVFINIPDFNAYLRFLNGKLGLKEKLYLLYLKRKKVCHELTGLAFGFLPSFQRRGLDGLLITTCADRVRERGLYNGYEMGWSGDWNPRMINLYHRLGAEQSRHLITYRYIFDRAAHPFERHPPMDYAQNNPMPGLD